MKILLLALGTFTVLSPLSFAQGTTPKKPARAKPAAPAEPVHPKDLKAVSPKDVDDAIRRGVELILARQESLDETRATKPEWPYEGVYRVNVGKEMRIPIGYRIGGTSIVAMSLIDALDRTATKTEESERASSKDIEAAIERALGFVLEKLEDPLMSTDFEKGYDVRGWGHAYGLAFLLRLREAQRVPAEYRERVDAKVRDLVAILATTQIGSHGGWNYSRPGGDDSSASTFMTAPTLQILFEAKRQNEAVDGATIERGLKTLEDARLATGAFQYGTDPDSKNGKGFEDVPGSTGRSPVCETTLYLAGRGSVERIRTSLDQFFEHWRWLEQRRKQTGTHVPPYYIAPYYFFYAHRYAAQAIEFLPEAERADYRKKLYELLWYVREEDGGWNDRVFPRSESFGTAMTITALREPFARRPATWTPPAPSKDAKAGTPTGKDTKGGAASGK